VSPFEPLGEQARWRILYAELLKLEPGQMISYADMAACLGMADPEDRHLVQMATRRAGQELEKTEKHAIQAVRGQGYMVVKAEQHFELARIHQAKSVRSVKRAKSKTDNVDFNDLSPDLVALAQATSNALSLQLEYIRRLDVRQTKLAESLNQVATKQERTDEELAELRNRLAALERRDVP
jgi:DNA-binding GntR family transcriptional regulator